MALRNRHKSNALGRTSATTEPDRESAVQRCRARKAGLFTAFAGMGATASIIPAIIPLTAHNSNSPITEYLGAVPALFFGLMAGVLLASILLRTTTPAATLTVGSLVQFTSLIALAVTPDGAVFVLSAGAAGVGFGLCEASGSILARVMAGEATAGLLSSLTGTVALVASFSPLLVVTGLSGMSAVPLLTANALVHLTTAAVFLLAPETGGGFQATGDSSEPAGSGTGALLILLAPVSAALLVYVGVETIFAGWSAAIPAEVLTLTPTAAAAGTSAFWILMATGRYATWIILKTTVTPTVALICTSIIATMCFALAGALRQSHPTTALATAGLAVVCLGPMYSLILGIGLTRVDLQDGKKAVGILVACGAAGGACIPAVLLSVTSHPASPGVFLAAAVLTAVIAPLIVRPPLKLKD